MKLGFFVAILFSFLCFAAIAGAPRVVASHSEVIRVDGGLVSDVVVDGWVPGCAEVRVEPPRTIVDFSPDEPLDTIEMAVASCSGAVPRKGVGVWQFRGADAWRTRKPLAVGLVPGRGHYECRVMWDLGGGAMGPVDFVAEWRVVEREDCGNFASR